MREKIKKIYIDGMSCAHCESKIQAALSDTTGILEVQVSYNDGTAIVAYDESVIDYARIKQIIRELDYRPKDEQEILGNNRKKVPKWAGLLGAVIVLLGGFFIFNQLGLFDFINIFPTAKENTALGALFVLGLLTSVHCVAMCGGINISQCVVKEKPQDDTVKALSESEPEPVREAAREQTEDKPHSKTKINASTFRSSLLYNLGRVVSYTVIGFIVGALGSVLTFSDIGRGIVAIVAAVFMIIMGLNMLGLLTFLRRFTPRMPKFFAKLIGKQKAKSKSPLIVGLLNGLMPCGPLQTMQIYALSTGSAFLGAFSMFLFSLGTVPLMFFVGALSSVLTKKLAKKIMTVSAVLVIVMGMFMFNNGAALSGLPLPGYFGGVGSTVESVVDYQNNIQTVSFDLETSRYSAIKVKRGIPVVWIIKADEDILNGCNGEIHIKQWNISKELIAGDNTIEFTPETSGTFSYSCWMGMIRSKIIVIA